MTASALVRPPWFLPAHFVRRQQTADNALSAAVTGSRRARLTGGDSLITGLATFARAFGEGGIEGLRRYGTRVLEYYHNYNIIVRPCILTTPLAQIIIISIIDLNKIILIIGNEPYMYVYY